MNNGLVDPSKLYSHNSKAEIEFYGSGILEIEPINYKVFEMEAIMKAMAQIEIETNHYFSDGLYAREIIIPAGVTLCGEIHKYKNLNILSKGSMLIYGLGKVKAPFTIVSLPGTKRIAHTLEECVWTTIHATEETDVDKIKNHFIAQTEKEWLEFCKFETSQLELGFN